MGWNAMQQKLSGLLLGLMGGLVLMGATVGEARAWWNDDWSLRKPLTLDASPAGADIADPIGTLPLLVRLHSGNFNFEAAKPDGSDLRFVAADDKTPLTFHIEKWDALLGEAFVWVQVPQMAAGAQTSLWLYYGNPKASALGAPGETFDGSTVLAYHFTERTLPARDWSAWNNTALAAGRPADGALIGSGLALDGRTMVPLPGSPGLAWRDGGEMTWSAWVRPGSAAQGGQGAQGAQGDRGGQGEQVIYSRQEAGRGVVIGLDGATPFVEVWTPAGLVRAPGAPTVTPGSWHHLAVTSANGQTTLYVDGHAARSIGMAVPALSGQALIGGEAPAVGAAVAGTAGETALRDDGALRAGGPSAEASETAAPKTAAPKAAALDTAAPEAMAPDTGIGTEGAAAPAAETASAAALGRAGFVGEMDELRIATVARSPGYLRASAVSQGPDGATLVRLGLDEETASWISGYFAVILGSVTLDGWVVIAILAVMAVLSWLVMADKAVYLSRLERANARFLGHFRAASADLTALDHGDPAQVASLGGRLAEADQEMIRSSSLYRIYHLGAVEILDRRTRGTQALSAEAIAAIRAALDAGQVRESQRMNRLMVLLTIAISGGPFLGLLGTVVGVMITFAAIAASGDVNVNAIAPGIAAALVATVAGLAVAIPALFGYNWLLMRVKNASATMNVFVDELLTKMAESYRSSGVTRAAE
jgi:biopolymer transport protein ExbB